MRVSGVIFLWCIAYGMIRACNYHHLYIVWGLDGQHGGLVLEQYTLHYIDENGINWDTIFGLQIKQDEGCW